MSVCGRRRYDGNFINLNLFNKKKIEEEIDKFTVYKIKQGIDLQPLSSNYIDHIDFSILILMIKHQEHLISDKELFTFLDKIDGYCYAYETELIDFSNLVTKINKEVLFEDDCILAVRGYYDFNQ